MISSQLSSQLVSQQSSLASNYPSRLLISYSILFFTLMGVCDQRQQRWRFQFGSEPMTTTMMMMNISMSTKPKRKSLASSVSKLFPHSLPRIPQGRRKLIFESPPLDKIIPLTWCCFYSTSKWQPKLAASNLRKKRNLRHFKSLSLARFVFVVCHRFNTIRERDNKFTITIFRGTQSSINFLFFQPASLRNT